MKKLSLLILLLLSFNCLSQETILDCKGKGQKESEGEVVSSYSREFVLYFDEQENTVNFGDSATMCHTMKVISGSKFSEKYKIDKKKIDYSCVVSNVILSGKNETHSDSIRINRVTGMFVTSGVKITVSEIIDTILYLSEGTCKKASNKF